VALIDVQNVTKIFGPTPKVALRKVKAGMGKTELLAETGHTLGIHDVSLSIEQGEIFVIMGLSGSGKSTLIRHFNRLIDPTDGKIVVDGEDVLKLSNKGLEGFPPQPHVDGVSALWPVSASHGAGKCRLWLGSAGRWAGRAQQGGARMDYPGWS
jgi:hypothetical protein